MAKKKDDDKPADPPADEVTLVDETPAPAGVDVFMRATSVPCGDGFKVKGDKLATVILEPGVTLNYLACCIENSMAGPVED